MIAATQGVLLRYRGGEVYALARPVAGLVWDVSVAGSVLRCIVRNASELAGAAWFRTRMTLAEFAAASTVERSIDVMTAARVAAEAAEHARVTLEMERTVKPAAKAAGVKLTKPKAKRAKR